MKRILSLAVCLLLCAVLCAPFSGCAPQSEEPRAIRIGITVYDRYDTFVGEMMKHFTAMAAAMEEETGVGISVMNESADKLQTAQNNQVESFIEAGCDVICVNLVERTDVAVIIDRAEAAGIPILFFNRELVEEDLFRSDLLYYVGANAEESGVMQGEIVAENWQAKNYDKNGDGMMQYVMLEGEAGHQDAIVRTETAVNTVAAAGIKMERLEDEIANWVRSQAETKMTQWLEAYGEDVVEVVFANNDDMALGAIDALKRAGISMDEWPLVAGIDGTPVGLEAVVRGEMAGTVYNDAHGQAEGLLNLAWALATGDEMPRGLTNGKYIRLPYQKVQPENVARFIG